MTAYIIRRVLWGILLLIIVCALTFVFFRIIPTGDPAVLRAGRDPQPKLIAQIRASLGLNHSLIVQFWDYLKGIFLHFDLGFSYYSRESVRSLIGERLPASLAAALAAVSRGASIVRVHDVRETVDALKVWDAIEHCAPRRRQDEV